MRYLKNKVAIVAGAGSGFGKAMSELYVNEDVRVVVSDIAPEAGEETVDNIKKAGGNAVFVKADVSVPSKCQNLFKQAVNHFGRLDIAFPLMQVLAEQVHL